MAARARGHSLARACPSFTDATDSGRRSVTSVRKTPSCRCLLPLYGRRPGLECFASCPVCNDDLPLCGPDGVMVHVLATHADSPEAHWVMKQLGVLVLAP